MDTGYDAKLPFVLDRHGESGGSALGCSKSYISTGKGCGVSGEKLLKPPDV